MRVRYTQIADSPADSLYALEQLTQRAERDLRARELPRLYSSGVRYRFGPYDRDWLTPSQVFARGAGSCEDLAAWRAAELRVTGEDPRARPVVRHGGRPRLWHVIVRRGDGSTEDPSRVLGMPE